MNTIKHIHKIKDLLSDAALQELEDGAALHLRYSNIEFKIESAGEKFLPMGRLKELVVGVRQGKSQAENYADAKTLITRTKELFAPFFPDRSLQVHPHPYTPAIVEVVTPEWIKGKMMHKGVKIRDMVIDTGIDKTNFSAWINGTRDMGQTVKAMFYFYFTRK